MFTGIIETLGKLTDVRQTGSNKTFRIESSLSGELQIDQSVAHNGVCLTVEDVSGNSYTITAVQETLSKTNLGNLKSGDRVNLERSLLINGRLDGHMVQGHVDTTAICILKEEMQGSWIFRFEFPSAFKHLVIEKGSICLNGVSLTIFDVTEQQFSVAIIPYTYNNTNISDISVGTEVNIEFDMIGKYVSKLVNG